MKTAILCVLFLQYANSDSDGKKWVWSSARRNDDERIYTGIVGSSSNVASLVPPSQNLFKPADFDDAIVSQSTKLRYEVSEPGEFPTAPTRPPRPAIYPEEQYRPTQTTINGFRPDSFRPTGSHKPNRPSSGFRPTDSGYRPDSYRPGQGNGYRPSTDNSYRPSIDNSYRPSTDNSYRPSTDNGYRPSIDNSYRPTSSGGYRPTSSPSGRPILTGPVPSWEQDNDKRYKQYDKCKCVHSFNCVTPGIQFGSCDVDKQYCCYKDLHHHHERPGGVRDRDQLRPVLAGPGGPVDRPGNYRPSNFDQDRFDERPHSTYSDYNRYPKGYRGSTSGLEDAYKKGLESAIHETFQTPSRYDNKRDFKSYYDRDYSSDFNRRPNSKYGLYEPTSFYGGRSANSTILAESDKIKV